jgi:ABC-type branched-subunit amino acid transport system substrate-binding protein
VSDAKHMMGRRIVLRGLASSAALISAPAILRAEDTIKVGFLGPLSGALAFVGQTNQNCLALAVDEANAAGGLNGRKLEIVAEDSQMSTRTTLEKARKLFGSDGVAMITGAVLPSEREAMLSVATSAKKLVFYPNFDEGRCHPSLVTTGLAVNQSIPPTVDWLTANVGKSIYVLASDLGTNRDVLIPAIKSAIEAKGGRVAGVQLFPFGTRDFGPALQQVKEASVDMVWHAIGDDPVTFVKQYRSFDMKPQLVTNLVHESIAAATEGAATGALSVESYFMSIDNSANRKLLDTYTARYSASIGRAVRGKTVVLPMGERTYESLKIWAEAVRLAGSLDADKIRSAFPQLEIEAPRGSIRIDASGRILCETLLGRVQPDNGIETIARLGRFDAKCIAG